MRGPTTLDPEQIKAALHTTSDIEGGFVDRTVAMVQAGTLPRDLFTSTFLWARKKPRHQFQYFRQALTVRAAEIGVKLEGRIIRVGMFEKIRCWWRRPCGGRDVLALALPLIISTMSFTVMTFIDRMFLTWYSIDAVAAAMPAAMLQFTLISFPLGVATYVNTFVAQYQGSGRPRQIGPIVWQGIWIGLAAAVLLLPRRPWPASISSMRVTTPTS